MKRPIALSLLLISFWATAQVETYMAHAQTQTTAALPNGASSINETFQDWTVVCGSGENGRTCVMSQHQRKNDTRQLVLAAEFNMVTQDEVRGTLVLPFGLRLADGVILQIDEGDILATVPFGTCLPAGCLVPVAFDRDAVSALRSGAVLKLRAVAHDTGKTVQLGVSLKGFTAAQNRAAELLQD